MVDRIPASLLTALADLVHWLDSQRVPAMIIGGVAASLLGRPRLTRDIDALAILPESSWSRILAAARGHGIVPRIDAAIDFTDRSRVLLLKHIPSGIDIDLTFGGLQFEQEALDRSVAHDIGGVLVRLPRVEDLLIMKAVARRATDVQDIEGLLDANPQADVEIVRRWVREFAAAMAMPEMLDDLDRILQQRRR